MAATGRNVSLVQKSSDGDGVGKSPSSPVPGPSGKRRRLPSVVPPAEQRAKIRQSKKKYEQTRVHVGKSWAEWEEQRMRDGFPTQAEWIAHLLALHEARCLFHQVKVSLEPDTCDREHAAEPEAEERSSTTSHTDEYGDDDVSTTSMTSRPAATNLIGFQDLEAMEADVDVGSEIIMETPQKERKEPTFWRALMEESPISSADLDLENKHSTTRHSAQGIEDSPVVKSMDFKITSTPLQTPAFIMPSPILRAKRDEQFPMEVDLGLGIQDGEELDEEVAGSETNKSDTEENNPLELDDDDVINVTFDDPAWESMLVEEDDEEDTSRQVEEPSSIDSESEDPDKTWQPPSSPEECTRDIKNGRLTRDVEAKECISEAKCIAHNRVLVELVHSVVGEKCRKCGGPLQFRESMLASCLFVSWECQATKSKSHTHGTWSSQPRIAGMYASNLLVPVCLVLSGNNYRKMALFAKFLNLGYPGEANTYRIQRLYIHPSVMQYWEEMQGELFSEVKEPLVLSGDGRNDSPGHSAQYCTYSLMDCLKMNILSTVNVDVREADFKSTNMERIGFRRAVREVRAKAPVKEVVTDEHPQIRATMKNEDEFKDMVHQFDLWHKCKNLAKKLAAASKLKGCSAIGPWIPYMVNHLWYCAQHCHGDTLHLKEHWIRVMHHVCNEHTWVDTSGITSGKCDHPVPVPAEHEGRPWLDRNSVAANAMRKVLFDKAFLGSLQYLRNFRHTGMLEVFHAHMLMYASKRNSYKYLGYQVRTIAAAIDFNKHASREIATDKDNKARMIGKYNKQAEKWYAQYTKKPKEYSYIPDLLGRIVKAREYGYGMKERLDTKAEPLPGNPQVGRKTRAAVLKPPMEQLIREHKTRFQKSD